MQEVRLHALGRRDGRRPREMGWQSSNSPCSSKLFKIKFYPRDEQNLIDIFWRGDFPWKMRGKEVSISNTVSPRRFGCRVGEFEIHCQHLRGITIP